MLSPVIFLGIYWLTSLEKQLSLSMGRFIFSAPDAMHGKAGTPFG